MSLIRRVMVEVMPNQGNPSIKKIMVKTLTVSSPHWQAQGIRFWLMCKECASDWQGVKILNANTANSANCAKNSRHSPDLRNTALPKEHRDDVARGASVRVLPFALSLHMSQDFYGFRGIRPFREIRVKNYHFN